MSDEQKTWTLNASTRASNPGNLRVSPIRWVRHYPKWPLIWFCSLAFFLALGWFVHWSFWIVAVLVLALNWLYWKHVGEHFRRGCANPAIIVSMKPMLIAVSTDLTKGYGTYPVIKIIEKNLPTACGQIPDVGARLAAVALYSQGPDANLPHWVDFDPRPVDCASGDQIAIQSVMSTFTPDDWHELNTWLKQVPRPFVPGLYKIQPSV